MIIKRLITFLALLGGLMLAGCANLAGEATLGDASRLYKPNARIDKLGTVAALDGTIQELYLFQVEWIGVDGKPYVFKDKDGNLTTVLRWQETARSLPFAREMVLGMSPGVAVALINKRAAENVAEIGKCAQGANCGTVFNNQVASVAEAVTQNTINDTSKVNIGVGCMAAGTCPPPAPAKPPAGPPTPTTGN